MVNRHFNDLFFHQQVDGKFLDIKLAFVRRRLPEPFREEGNHFTALSAFGEKIIEATAETAGSYRFHVPTFLAYGGDGISTMCSLAKTIRAVAPGVPIIADIDASSAEGWFDLVFRWIKADAVVVSPFYGIEPLSPFFQQEGAAVFVRCYVHTNTANSSMRTFRQVAVNVAQEWNKKKNCGIMMSGASSNDCRYIRNSVGNIPIFVDGAAQENVSQRAWAAQDHNKQGVIVSTSWDFIHEFSEHPDFAARVGVVAQELSLDIRSALKEHRKELA